MTPPPSNAHDGHDASQHGQAKAEVAAELQAGADERPASAVVLDEHEEVSQPKGRPRRGCRAR